MEVVDQRDSDAGETVSSRQLSASRRVGGQAGRVGALRHGKAPLNACWQQGGPSVRNAWKRHSEQAGWEAVSFNCSEAANPQGINILSQGQAVSNKGGQKWWDRAIIGILGGVNWAGLPGKR